MFPTILIRRVEIDADNLAAGVLRSLRSSGRCNELLQRISNEELQRGIYDIYSHLGEWLFSKLEFEVEERYMGLGMRRAKQKVPLRELLWAVNTVKTYLLDYLIQEGLSEQPVDLCGDRQLLQALQRFFNLALYYVAAGYESVRLVPKAHPVASAQYEDDLNVPARWVP